MRPFLLFALSFPSAAYAGSACLEGSISQITLDATQPAVPIAVGDAARIEVTLSDNWFAQTPLACSGFWCQTNYNYKNGTDQDFSIVVTFTDATGAEHVFASPATFTDTANLLLQTVNADRTFDKASMNYRGPGTSPSFVAGSPDINLNVVGSSAGVVDGPFDDLNFPLPSELLYQDFLGGEVYGTLWWPDNVSPRLGSVRFDMDAACAPPPTGDDDDDEEDGVEICHYPPGNPDNAHTIVVGEPAVDNHVEKHGDTLGPCEDDDTGVAAARSTGSADCSTAGGLQLAWLPLVGLALARRRNGGK